jgi:hypothetical protein
MCEYQGDSENSSRLEREWKVASDLAVWNQLCKFLPPEVQDIFEGGVKVELIRKSGSLRFDCPTAGMAARLFSFSGLISLAACGLKESMKLSFIPRLEIYCNGQQFTPRINPEKLLKESFMTKENAPRNVRSLGLNALVLDLNELYANENPIYITQMSDQKVLFANRTALVCNNRSAGDMLGKEITALWDDEVLSELMERLQRDGELREYNYPGYRWSREPGSPIWRRDLYMFVANYKLLEFLGSVCRFCTILSAEKIQS